MSFYDNNDNDDDDFQIPLTRTTLTLKNSTLSQKPLKKSSTSSFTPRLSKTRRRSTQTTASGKENVPLLASSSSFCLGNYENEGFEASNVVDCSLDSIPSSFDFTSPKVINGVNCASPVEKNGFLNKIGGFSCNSIESKLITSRGDSGLGNASFGNEEIEGELGVLLNLRAGLEERAGMNGSESPHHSEGDGLVDDGNGVFVECPLCGVDISDLSEEQRQLHTNDCLDKEDNKAQDQVVLPHQEREEPREDAQAQYVVLPHEGGENRVSRKFGDVSAVVEWLRGLDLAKYEDAFVREEIDWDTLQWLTEEDLFSIGITALGPRKKIVHALSQLRKGSGQAIEADATCHAPGEPRKSTSGVEMPIDVSEQVIDSASKIASNKLITDYFPGSSNERKKVCNSSKEQGAVVKRSSGSGSKHVTGKKNVPKGKLKDPPSWCCVPGTPFRVDAFRYLRGDCSHWFLTHFHMDHYQGLTRSFCHGKIYCSLITATLVNMKIGIPWERIQVLPLNQKINIVGIDVTCVDANHCPGAIILLFEPPNGCFTHWRFSL